MVHVFGIRHHGPGCARSLVAALEELRPDVIVLEAPADLQPVMSWAGHADMQPPVAMLVSPREAPGRSVIFPLAEFSPEWQALRWAAGQSVPVRAMDLPMRHQFALDDAPDVASALPAGADRPAMPEPSTFRADPLAVFAQAAGYPDHELWWEEQIERRADAAGLFLAIQEAMRSVREEFAETSPRDLLREAYMRKTIRGVQREGFSTIAVVCGAWHGPVLDQPAIDGQLPGCRPRDDQARLKGLPKVPTAATWIPWTLARLAYRSGYGAGVTSPGWYAHLWESQSQAATRWVVNAARLLREQDLSSSSACVIDACRLADALAALRELRSPGLRELNEAILSVLCQGDSAPLQLIRRELEIGDRLGRVPLETPAVPLAQDVQRLQTRLRLKPTTQLRTVDLDLRREHAKEQSCLLRRLQILGIAWGRLQEAGGGQSTFHELWSLQWEPEFAIALVEASVWGNTLEAAATSRLMAQAKAANTLPELLSFLEAALQAGLHSLIPLLAEQFQSRSAVTVEVLQLMAALPPLARLLRYGNVRDHELSSLQPLGRGIVARVLIGLPAACVGVDQELAGQLVDGMQQLQEALELLQWTDLRDEFRMRLQDLARAGGSGLIRGWATRCLLEQQLLDESALEQLTMLALGHAVDPDQSAAWITGLLRGSGLLLLHQSRLWRVMDRWLTTLAEPAFVATLPLLRRAFAAFSPAERRQMGACIQQLEPTSGEQTTLAMSPELNVSRAALVYPILARILGARDDC